MIAEFGKTATATEKIGLVSMGEIKSKRYRTKRSVTSLDSTDEVTRGVHLHTIIWLFSLWPPSFIDDVPSAQD